MSVFRLTPRAVRSLEEIFAWTLDRFGEAKARDYGEALIARCKALAADRPPRGRPCSVLLEGHVGTGDLLYYREGGHFILFERDEAGMVVIELIHERRDLPGLIEQLLKRPGPAP